MPVKTNPLDSDDDSDGRSDGEEVNTPWTVSVVGSATSKLVYSDPRNADKDFDELNDAEEQSHGTDPEDPNTDGAADVFTLKDGIETQLGLNPLDPSDMCVRVKFSDVKVTHDFVDIIDGDVKGTARVQRYSGGVAGTSYFLEPFSRGTIDDGVLETITGTQYTSYVLMKAGESIRVATGGVQFRPKNGVWWDVFDGDLIVASTEFSVDVKEKKFSYSRTLNGAGGTFEPYFYFQVMTEADVLANPTDTFCQGL
jgi:hypothetical protein